MGKPRSVFPQIRISLVILLALVLFVFLGDQLNFFENQELGFLDLRFQLRSERAAHPDIVIVDVDDQSINRIGHWPWPRSYHAALLTALTAYRPRLVLYDVLFTEASTQPKEDELLAYSMRQAGNVIGAFFFRSENPFIAFFPIDPIKKAMRALGYVNIIPDPDGRVRRIEAFISPEQEKSRYYHTSVTALRTLLPDEEARDRILSKVPLEKDNTFWLNFPGRFSLFKRIPFYQIVEGHGANDAELRKLIAGKIVIVGVTATGGGDLRPTPFSPAYPGAGIQATAIHTLLTGDFLKRVKGGASFIILLLLALLAGYLTWKNPPVIALLTVFILNAFYLIWNFLAFAYLGWILPVFPALLVIWGIYVLILFLQYMDIRLEGELLARELSLAAQIQENFLPRELPKIPGFDIGFHCRFAKTVGGDLYDWVALGERKLGLCVGDVSGKGVPAALYMARVISEWRTLAQNFNSTSQLLTALNDRLVASGMHGFFVTLLYLILDLDSRSLLISNAGHEPLFYYHSRAGKGEWIRGDGGRPLGLFAGGNYPEARLAWEEGDLAFLMSDGVKELRGQRGDEWGYEGVEGSIKMNAAQPAGEIVQGVFHSMDSFAKGRPAHDDRTVLCVKMTKGGNG